MANIHDIKQRMKSISETMHMTKAMKLISAARLRKARQQLESNMPFFDKVRETMEDILCHSGGVKSPYFDLRHEKTVKKKGYIIVSGDKSLAGGYNHNIFKTTEEELKKDPDSILFVAGNIGHLYFEKHNYNLYSDFFYQVHDPTIYRAREIAELIVKLFNNRELDEVYIVFTLMINTLKLEPQVMKLLPLSLETFCKNKGEIRIDEEKIIYEPSPEAVLNVLVPKYLKGIIYSAFVEGFTSEQCARMTSMDNATNNAEEIMQDLELSYNRARQSAITQEISEIVGGVESMTQQNRR